MLCERQTFDRSKMRLIVRERALGMTGGKGLGTPRIDRNSYMQGQRLARSPSIRQWLQKTKRCGTPIHGYPFTKRPD